KTHAPDVLLLQELKSTDDKFPFDDFTAAGYHAAVSGQKSWNGVAIIAKQAPQNILRGLPGDDTDEQARYIEADIGDLRVASVYLPNGNPVDSEKYPYKLRWCDRLAAQAAKLLESRRPVVL